MIENSIQSILSDNMQQKNILVALETLKGLSHPLQLLDIDGNVNLKKLPGCPTCFSIINVDKSDPASFLNVQTTTKIPFYIGWNSKDKRLGEYPDQEYHQSVIYPWYEKAKLSCEPMAQSVRAYICERMVQYQRLIIPYKNANSLLILYWVDFLLDMGISRGKLTPRERECLLLLTQGFSAKQIAQDLNLRTRTIEHYIESARKKLCAKNATQAAANFVANCFVQGKY